MNWPKDSLKIGTKEKKIKIVKEFEAGTVRYVLAGGLRLREETSNHLIDINQQHSVEPLRFQDN